MIDHPRYLPLEVLGTGAQGRVVRVIDRERPEAKLVAKVLASSAPEAASRLEGELSLLARLRVPGLVRAYDFARDAHGVPFLVEDLVEGADPATWVGSSAARLRTLAADLSETLAALHDAGFVHGDVKPDNVRLPDSGRAVLLDLGASLGGVYTPAFAAPELLAGARAGALTDLHALGATLASCATKAPPDARPLRERAPWVPPSLADLVDRLRAKHPADRPASARDVLAALGREASRAGFESASRGAHARELDVRRVLSAGSGVLYVTGPSGAGKSHLAREVVTRALLAGRSVRLVRFPEAAQRLVDFFRGAEASWPFEERGPMLLVLDDLHAAHAELADALDAYRCRVHLIDRGLAVVATTRACPPGAPEVALGVLDDRSLSALARELGAPDATATALVRESGGMPGWLVASLGRVPLTKDAALARVRELPPPSRDELALVATMGGVVPANVLSEPALGPLFGAGLLARERESVRLASPHLAADLAAALGDFAIADRAGALALARPALAASAVLAIAQAPSPPAERAALLAEAARRARRDGARSLEIEALLSLAAAPAERTAERLERLERLTRDAGTSRAHPQVLAWLEEAATRDARVAPLALRRRAEERARAGDLDAARARASEARRAAVRAHDVEAEAWALATEGAVALFGADWAAADAAFAAARETIAASEGDAVDHEELARLEHNLGVVALYRGRAADAANAFERSLAIKRGLGDRGGVRACLLNLGIALAKEARYDEADRALVEATALAEALGQHAGRGWCLAARADVAVRRARASDAERYVAEAEAIGDAVPAAVRADLALLRAQIALLEGDGAAARAAIATLDASLRAGDALVDGRARVLEARSLLATLPADRRGAARLAIAALRVARAAGLAEIEAEASAALRAARRLRSLDRDRDHDAERDAEGAAMTTAPMSDELWTLLRSLAGGEEDGTMRVAAFVLAEARAERVFVAALDAAGRVVAAWGADVDGLSIAHAETRLDAELVAAARRRGAVVYQADVATSGGRGARICVTGARSAVVAEHRFLPAAFDHVDAAAGSRWSTLADLAVRLARDEASSSVAQSSRASSSAESSSPSLSTAVPRREPLRDYPTILGRSPSLRRALAQLDAAVDTDLPVVVRGETGTGKELFARALHDHGTRAAAPFVAINCAAIADSLFEAELFGHARGAFTGADRARPGLLARAEGGTLFLDEIGELPLARQATLLRALESRRYRAVGSDDERPFDVRIVAATNRDLDHAVEVGEMRRDLLYRLRVLEIVVPPLRERAGDIEILARHFLARAGSRATLTPGALAALEAHAFPGNVRELAHLAQRLALARVERIEAVHLPRAVRAGLALAPPSRRPEPAGERAEVDDALARTGGNISRAALLLGLSRHGLKKRMLRLGVRAKAEGKGSS